MGSNSSLDRKVYLKRDSMKMYLLVRKDLSKRQRAVQAGHAIAQNFLDHGIPDNWDNGTMVYLGVDNEHSLLDWIDKLGHLKASHFIEPDIGDQATALCIIDDGKRFSNLPLLG